MDSMESGGHKYFMLVCLSGCRKQKKLLENAPFQSGGSDRARKRPPPPRPASENEKALFCILLYILSMIAKTSSSYSAV